MAKKSLPAVLALLLAAFVLQGCLATTPGLRQARELFNAGDYDRARELLQQAAAANPRDSEIRTLLFRAQLSSYQLHLYLARAKRRSGEREQAIREYRQALEIFPGNSELQAELDGVLHPRQVAAEKEPEPTVVPPVELKVSKDEKISLSLKNTPITNIFKSLGKSYNVNFIFDKDFRDFLHSVEIENTTFFEIIRVLCMVSGSQYRVLDPSTVIVYPDIFAKKKAFGLRGIKTFYLSNIKAEDARKTVQTVFRDEQLLIQEDTNLNALIIRADYDALADVERFLTRIDKQKNEVEVHVEILEINRSLINKLGADFSTGSLGVAAGTVGDDGKISSVMDASDLGDTSFFLTIPSVALNFLETDSNNKILAKPNLRGIDGEEISFMVGDEVPIPETQFQAIAAGGINSSPVTTYRYRNVGVEIKITPFVHQNNEVTLKTKLTINFISSGATSSFPTFGKREIENKIRLREGETNIIGGLIRDDVRGSLNGIPALSRIPLLGKLFGNSEKNISQTDLIFSITPKIIRRTPISDRDQETIWSGLEQPAAGAVTAPLPAAGDDEATEEPAEVPAAAAEEEMPVPDAGARISISPGQAEIPANSDTYFSLRIHSPAPLASLSFSGSVSGGECEIVEIKTDALNDKNVKTLKNITGSTFDVGLSFSGDSLQALAAAIQLRIRFRAKGKYVLSVANASAYDSRRNRVEVTGVSVPIDVR
ncbi:MAG: tetratricopeptide repeat protein [Candidatus Aminicenantes bacterium]|nr:tetratricopeptide repeat protein [Candidatus Aminicenantes bacterium]